MARLKLPYKNPLTISNSRGIVPVFPDRSPEPAEATVTYIPLPEQTVQPSTPRGLEPIAFSTSGTLTYTEYPTFEPFRVRVVPSGYMTAEEVSEGWRVALDG